MFKVLRHSFCLVAIFCATSVQVYASTEYKLGIAYDNINYTENNMTEKGWIPGVYLGFRWVLDAIHALRLRVDYSSGNLKLNGTNWGSEYYDGVTTKDNILNVDLGADFRLNERVFFSIGLAQRIWNDNMVVSFTRKSTYSYLPVGLTYFFSPNLFFKAVQNYWLVGSTQVNMSSIPHTPPYNDVKVSLPSGNGWSTELGWRANNNPSTNIEFTIYYRQWAVNQSESEMTGGVTYTQPSNKTNNLGFNLGVLF